MLRLHKATTGPLGQPDKWVTIGTREGYVAVNDDSDRTFTNVKKGNTYVRVLVDAAVVVKVNPGACR